MPINVRFTGDPIVDTILLVLVFVVLIVIVKFIYHVAVGDVELTKNKNRGR